MPRLDINRLRRMDRKALPPALRKLVEEVEADTDRRLREPVPSKYRSRLYEDADHILYDSEWEHDVCVQLELERRAGLIASWSYAPRFVLQRDAQRPRTMITYRPDYIVRPPEPDKPWYVIDAKGVRTQLFMAKVRMWKVRFPTHPLIVWTRKDGKREL